MVLSALSALEEVAEAGTGPISFVAAAETFAVALQDPDMPSGRFRALRTLVPAAPDKSDFAAVVPALIAILRNPGGTGHSEAVELLGQLGDDRAVEPRREALGRREPWIRQAAAAALEALGEPQAEGG